MADIWQAVYRNTTGELVSVGTVIANPLPAGFTAVVLAGQPTATQRWNATTRAFEAIPAPTDDDLLTAQPRKQRLSPTAAAGKAALRDFLDDAIKDAQAMDWFNTQVQSDGSVPAAAKTAIGNLNTAAYNRAKNAAVAWFQAT